LASGIIVAGFAVATELNTPRYVLTVDYSKELPDIWLHLFLASSIPCTLLLPVVLQIATKMLTRLGKFIRSVLFAVAASVSSCFVAIYIEHNWSNFFGYLAWSWVYALALLLVCYPLATLVVHFSKPCCSRLWYWRWVHWRNILRFRRRWVIGAMLVGVLVATIINVTVTPIFKCETYYHDLHDE
jgi:hypothetical protein